MALAAMSAGVGLRGGRCSNASRQVRRSPGCALRQLALFGGRSYACACGFVRCLAFLPSLRIETEGRAASLRAPPVAASHAALAPPAAKRHAAASHTAPSLRCFPLLFCAASAAAAKGGVAKAATAAKAARAGTRLVAKRIRTKVHFYRPKTLTLQRKPKYLRSLPRASASKDLITGKSSKFVVIKSPLTSEAAMKKIEDHNTLVFLCDTRANKRQIKAAVKELYDIDVEKVNTLIRPDGKKKAYVRLTKDQDALDVSNRIGII